VGWRKPAGQFFAAVCAAVGLPAGRVLHVGDDAANDYDGALAAGLQAVLLALRGRVAVGACIADLGELIGPAP
jgi:FMN phosphatase YigB (HAD superfamily)